MSGLDVIYGCLYGGAGAVLGVAYFLLLARTVHLHASQGASGLVIPLYFGRLAAAVVAFWLIAQQGALPLLSALAGFMIARFGVQHWVRIRG